MKTLNWVAKLSILGLLVAQQSAAFAADSGSVKNNPFKPQPVAAEKPPAALPAPQPATPQHSNGIGNGMSFNNMHTFNPADMAAPPPLPGAPGAPGAAGAESRPKYIGTVNGVGIYRAEAGYKFDETALAPVQNAPAK